MLTSDIHMKSIASTTYVIYSLELEQQSKNESIGLQISCRYSTAIAHSTAVPDGLWSNGPFFITGSEREHIHQTKLEQLECLHSEDTPYDYPYY